VRSAWNDERYSPEVDADERRVASGPQVRLARGLAQKLLRARKVAGPVVDIRALIELEGLAFVEVASDSRLSGQLVPTTREVIVNTKNRSVARQRFSAAHELGHWIMRHHEKEALPDDTLGFDGEYGDPEAIQPRSPVEREANAFAAEVQAAEPWLRNLRQPIRPGSLDSLARDFGVSRETMIIQLLEYKLL
jgi:Zn-dependent peptidase ImmA (M78 family)